MFKNCDTHESRDREIFFVLSVICLTIVTQMDRETEREIKHFLTTSMVKQRSN